MDLALKGDFLNGGFTPGSRRTVLERVEHTAVVIVQQPRRASGPASGRLLLASLERNQADEQLELQPAKQPSGGGGHFSGVVRLREMLRR